MIKQLYDVLVDADSIGCWQGEIEKLQAQRDEILQMRPDSKLVIGQMPKPGDTVEINGLRFYVHSVVGKRVFIHLEG